MRKISILARAAAAIFCAIAIVVAPLAQAQSTQEIYSGEGSEERQKCLSSPTVDCLFEIALQSAKKIEVADDRASALHSIAAAQAKAGHSGDAKNTFANALQAAKKIGRTKSRADALRDIAAAFAEAGHSGDAKNTFANALRTAEKIEDTLFRDSALSDIAIAFANAGFFPNALRTAEKLKARTTALTPCIALPPHSPKQDIA